MNKLEILASEFATLAHQGQVRKYTEEPYIVHPQAVATIVKNIPHTDEMVAAAWLHDVVEDTSFTILDVEYKFGSKIASLVEMLTDVSKLSDGNRKIRKEIDRLHLSKASPEAKTIKLADIIDNSCSIAIYDPNFSKIYFREITQLLPYLVEGNSRLFNLIVEILNQYYEKINLSRIKADYLFHKIICS